MQPAIHGREDLPILLGSMPVIVGVGDFAWVLLVGTHANQDLAIPLHAPEQCPRYLSLQGTLMQMEALMVSNAVQMYVHELIEQMVGLSMTRYLSPLEHAAVAAMCMAECSADLVQGVRPADMLPTL